MVLGEHLGYAFPDPQAVSLVAGVTDVRADRAYGMAIVPVTAPPMTGPGSATPP